MAKEINEDVRASFIKEWGSSDKRVLIIHNNCNDGRGTAGVVMYFNQILKNIDMTTIFLNYSDFDIDDLC